MKHRDTTGKEKDREKQRMRGKKVLKQVGGGDKYDVELEAGTFYQHVHWWRLAV